jgi:glyoxylase I family protein
MNNMIQGIHHVALKCSSQKEFETVKEFYQGVLGLKVRRTWGAGENAGTMLDTGSGLLEIFASGGDAAKDGTLRHIAFATDNVDACVSAVHRAGYPITVEPKNISIPSNPPLPARIAFCRGPLDEEIELFQEL